MAPRLILVGLACIALPVQALDLREAWHLLQYQGPTYLAAVHEKEAGEENRALGQAGLLPQINASAYDHHVNGTQEEPNALGRTVENDLHYESKGGTVQLRQALFNKQKMAEYRQGKQQADYSVAVFDAKTQDAAVRLAGRYFDVLLAHKTIELAKAKLKAFEQQVASAQRRFDLGDGTITDVDEATARRDLALAELIEAQDSLLVARRLLQEYLGEVPEQLATLREGFPTPPLEPGSLPDWIIKAQSDNPVLQARRYSVNAAEEEVNKAKAGHWPTLDFVLGYTSGESESVSTLNQRNRYGSVGVEMNIPLFSGGYVSARARQTVASRDQAEEELNAAREEIISGTTREFRGVQSGEARVRALEKAVSSSEKSLDSSKKGFLAGSSTNVDILNAEELVFTARRNLFEAKLKYLLSKLRLASAIGALGDDDIDQANAYLGPELLF
ncbi:TolC family outer membrane protein [Pseudomonas sp. 2FG]|uniref:TolC family outer membrane protein n=1 Tax=Pseudomonas sp. 2FG TaxID=2502191 RepID=UPI0010F4A19B|nr:TolC family outer membrane protein [Pseudomonas sp. 2FG]